MSNKKPSSDIQTIGNPALIATSLAPAIKENAPLIIQTYTSFMKVIFITLGISGGGYLLYKWGAAYRKKKLMERSANDPDIRAAMDIYAAIPKGLKTGDGSIFNPLGFVTDLLNQVALIWQNTDSERILEISKRIVNNEKVYEYFRVLYGEDLYPLLQKALSKTDLDLFIAHSGKSHSSSLTPALPKANALFVTKTVRIRKTPVNQEANYSNASLTTKIINAGTELIRRTAGTGSNIIGTAEVDKFLGFSTGREVADEDGKTVFVEFNGIKKGKAKWDTQAYVWKGAIRALNRDQIIKEFGAVEKLIDKAYFLDPDKLSGLDGESIPIKSTSKATIYNEFMHPISRVGRGFFLGRMTGTLNTGTVIYIKFITTNGTVRYIDSSCVSEYLK